MVWLCVSHKFLYVLFSVQFISVQSLSQVWLFVTPWIAAHQASLSITDSQSSLRLTSIESMMPSSHLIICRPLLLLPPIPPSFRIFSNESTLRMRWPKYWSFSFSIIPSPSPYHPSGSSQCTSPSIQYHASNLDWQLVSYMILYMFQCRSPKSSHPLPLPQSPKDCSIHQCLFCCLAYRVIVTIFLNSIYIR